MLSMNLTVQRWSEIYLLLAITDEAQLEHLSKLGFYKRLRGWFGNPVHNWNTKDMDIIFACSVSKLILLPRKEGQPSLT